MRSRCATASASSGFGRHSGWDDGAVCPAALCAAMSASMTPAFSQWTPAMPPKRLIFQLLQRAEHVLIADHHGGVGHVHLERGDAGGEHGGDLGADGLVPVVDGHVEAIIAARAAVGLFVPEIEAVLQRLALVRAGEVDDEGRAAVDGAARAGVEVVGGGGAADVEVEVRVGVDETREEQLAGHVDDGCAVRGQVFADGEDLFALDQHVGRAGSGGGDDGAAFE